MNFMNYNLDTKLNWTETIKNLLTEISGLYIGRSGAMHPFALFAQLCIKALQLKYSYVFYFYCSICYRYKLLKDLIEFLQM